MNYNKITQKSDYSQTSNGVNFFKLVYRVVAKIPKGRVATYGQIASMISSPRASRMVGWALHQLDGKPEMDRLPWHRVINREGRISTTCLTHPADEQASLLKKEGIQVEYRDGNYWVDLRIYLWDTSGLARRSPKGT